MSEKSDWEQGYDQARRRFYGERKVLTARIAKLEEAEKAATWPNVGDTYFLITSDDIIFSSRWGEKPADRLCLATGNCFRTKAEAEKELEARKVIAELRRCAVARKFVVGKYNYGISCNLQTEVLEVNVWQCNASSFGQVYFETLDQARSAIQTVGAARIIAAAKWLAMGE